MVDPTDPFAEWDAANARKTPQRPAPVEAPAPVVEAPAAPAAPAEPKSAPKSDDTMEFSLEDILAEFK